MRLAILSAFVVSCVFGQVDDPIGLPAPSTEILNLAIKDYNDGKCPKNAAAVVEEFYQHRRLLEARSIEMIESAQAVDEFNELLRNASSLLYEKDPDYHALLSLRSLVVKSKFDAQRLNNYEVLFFLSDKDVQSQLKLSSSQRKKIESIQEKVHDTFDRTLLEFEQEMKFTLKECFFATKSRLTDSEKRVFEEAYGEPLALEEAYKFAGPLSSRDRYLPPDIPQEFKDDIEIIGMNYAKYADDPVDPERVREIIDITMLRLLLHEVLGIDKRRQREMIKRLKDTDGIMYGELGFDRDSIPMRIEKLLNQSIEYPTALIEILSEAELKRFSQLELQLLQKTIFDFGLAKIGDRPTLITSDASSMAVLEECEHTKSKIAEVSKSLEMQMAAILREAFGEAESLLTPKQRAAVFPKLLPDDVDVVELLTGVSKK